MHMVWHDDECIQFHVLVMAGNGPPALLCNRSFYTQTNLLFLDITKQTDAILRGNSNEIRARPAAIVTR